MNLICAHGAARTCRVATRGFSLIEVLIAVLVLGVGLLGLASVFPVVISQQRDASDVIRGGAASTAIRAQIRANPEIVGELLSQDGVIDADEPNPGGTDVPNQTTTDAEPIFGMDPTFNPLDPPNIAQVQNGRYNPLTGFSYLWEADWNWSPAPGQPIGAMNVGVQPYLTTGGVFFRDPGERQAAGIGNNQPDLPVAARLFPRPYSVPGNGAFDGPQFVWDFVPRVRPGGDIQLVVFVRRISTGIRVGSGRTLSDVLTDTTNRVYPVSREPGTGVPTTDGTGEYAMPMSAQVLPIPSQDYPARRQARDQANEPLNLPDGIRVLATQADQISTVDGFEDIEPLAAVGQQFVDNLGVVRTVVEVLAVNDTNETVDLRVEPAFVRNTIEPAFAATLTGDFARDEAARIGKLRQIVFTPQVPIDVFTMEFSK
jgi:prepilin-type N-terminal cleavage/methylation domain-containing protein